MNHSCSATSLRSNLLRLIAFLFALGFLVWTVSPGWGAAYQDAEKSFKQRDFNSNDPVKIVEITTANKRVKLEEKFRGGTDWLRGTLIRLKNGSDKDIVYIELQFNFPETRSSGNEMSFRSELGNKPGVPIANSPLLLRPNEEFSFNLNDEEYEELVKFVNYRHRMSHINKTELKIGFVVFADFTAWSTGLHFKQNPNNPRHWIPSDQP